MSGHLNIFIQSPSLEFNSVKQYAPSTLILELKRKLELVVGMYKDDMVLALLNPEGKFERDIVEDSATLEEIGAKNDWIIKVTNKHGEQLKFEEGEKFKLDEDKYAERDDTARSFLASIKGRPNPAVQVGRHAIVKVQDKPDRAGIIKYVGEVHFKPGELMVGLELEQPTGKNDGQIDGKRYFHCPPKYGIFVNIKSVFPLDIIAVMPNFDHLDAPMEL